ncbi:MAG: DNA polymerase III subunit beta [Bacilli bacterium]|nr:DNA polymerase III subunit beta [Bacilli bacterium]
MKFTIDKNILLDSLVNVVRAISPKNIIPILNGIKFELNNEGLNLIASDSDLTIKSFIPKKDIKNIEEEGTIIIQSKYIIDIIRKMPSDEINIEVIDGLKIRIYTDDSLYNLNCLNTEDYPQIILETSNNPIILKSDIIKNMVKQTIFAVSMQESRPLLTGLNLKINNNIMEVVATDSYRLAKKTIVLENSYPESVDITIPGKNINEFDKILDEDGEVELHVFSNKVIFKYENIIFQSSLLNGNYPNTSNLIPNEFEIIINTNLDKFYSSIDRAALLTQSKDKNIVRMETNDKILNISSYASEIGKVEDKITIDKNTEKNIAISFSSKYMMDALKTFNEEELLILLNNDSSPIILKSIKDESLIQLILPIKTY